MPKLDYSSPDAAQHTAGLIGMRIADLLSAWGQYDITIGDEIGAAALLILGTLITSARGGDLQALLPTLLDVPTHVAPAILRDVQECVRDADANEP